MGAHGSHHVPAFRRGGHRRHLPATNVVQERGRRAQQRGALVRAVRRCRRSAIVRALDRPDDQDGRDEEGKHEDGEYIRHGCFFLLRSDKKKIRMEHWTLTGLALVVLGAVLVQTHRKEWYKSEWHRQEAGALSEVGVTTVLALLWPLAFGALVGWDFVSKHPVVLVGYAWTLVMLLWDMSSNYETGEEARRGPRRSRSTPT